MLERPSLRPSFPEKVKAPEFKKRERIISAIALAFLSFFQNSNLPLLAQNLHSNPIINVDTNSKSLLPPDLEEFFTPMAPVVIKPQNNRQELSDKENLSELGFNFGPQQIPETERNPKTFVTSIPAGLITLTKIYTN